jgi:hypothetical protein
MTSPFTPRPWDYRVSENCPDVWEINADFCESPLAEVPRWQEEDGDDSLEAEANAALMTAAPLLYETLDYAAQMLADFKPDFLRQLGLDLALEQIEAALRLATIPTRQTMKGV